MNLAMIEQVAFQAARAAGGMLLEMQPRVAVINQKYKDFVTDADIKAEAMILDALSLAFPGIPAYAEESGGNANTSGPLWVIDPIDGSVNFFRQDDHWGVSIAFVVDGHTRVGVVYFPKKALALSTRIDSPVVRRVSAHADMKSAQVWTDWIKGDPAEVVKVLDRLQKRTLYPEIRLSCTASMAAVATGRIEGYVHVAPQPFDFAAMALIVEKAGGRVTERDGTPWTAFSTSIVASNGLIHDELLSVTNE